MINLSSLTTKYRASLIAQGYRTWIKSNKRYLDVGCGNGIVTGYLVKTLKINIIGCDILYYLHSNIPFRKMSSINKLPFKDNSFDGVMINDVLHHMSYENQTKILEESFRVAKKVLIFEEEPTLSAKIFDYLLNRIHNSEMNIPLSYRTEAEWKKLFKLMSFKYKTEIVRKSFWYPFSHIAFLVYPANTGDKNDKD